MPPCWVVGEVKIEPSSASCRRLTQAALRDLSIIVKPTILRPPFCKGPIKVFRLTLSGLKFQVNLKQVSLTTLAKFGGIIRTDAL